MPDRYVFDACALIALLTKEEGWDNVYAVQTLANREEAIVIMHNATLAEVYYDALYRMSVEEADELVRSIFEMTVQFIDCVDVKMIKMMGFYKTRYKISFADSFVLATAESNGATVVTSDRHEFKSVEKDGQLKFHWIR